MLANCCPTQQLQLDNSGLGLISYSPKNKMKSNTTQKHLFVQEQEHLDNTNNNVAEMNGTYLNLFF